MDIAGVYYCSKCVRLIEKEGICPHCGYDHTNEKNENQALEIGSFLNNRYQLGAVLGQGGFGITYAAWDDILQIPVAVKEYYPLEIAERDTAYSDEVQVAEENNKVYLFGLQHFIRESRVQAMLQGIPGAVNVQDYFEDNGTAYIVMEYVRGKNLKEYTKEHRLDGKGLFEMLRPAVDALVVLHKQGILHRDITPSNFMVQDDGTVKLIDFGASAEMNRDQSMIVATKRYAPIEQYESTGKGLGAWSDVYGLCATIYAVLVGEPPQESVARVHRDELVPLGKKGVRLKKYQEKAITQGLVVDPGRRTQSMEEFRSRLYHLPLPEEVQFRKRMMRRAGCVVAVISMTAVGIVMNFTVGLPLGDGLRFALYGNGFHIIGSDSKAQEQVLPEKKLGIPVTAIEAEAFAGNEYLRKLTVSKNVENIGSMSFYGCSELESVTLEGSVEQIEEYAFADCGNLRSVTIQGDIGNLAENAFQGDSRYMTVWGSEDEEIRNLVKQTGAAYAVRSDYEVIEKEADEICIVSYLGEESDLILPSMIDGKTVTELLYEEEQAFAVSENTKSIVFPEYLTTIPQYLFANWISGLDASVYEIEKAVLNPNLQSIGAAAFTGTPLRTVELPKGLVEIEDSAFSRTNVEEIVIPDTVRKIGNQAFYDTGIREITLPDSVEELGAMVVSGCEELKNVTLPENMEAIPFGMFMGCSALEEITIPKSMKEIGMWAFSNCTALTVIELPEGLEIIGEEVFSGCKNLKYVQIPASVREISPTAFDNCSVDLVIAGESGSEAHSFAMEKGIAFEDTGSWEKNVLIPEAGVVSVTDSVNAELILPSYDEENQVLIREVISDGVPEGLKSVRLPLFAETIAYSTFSDCYELEEVEFSEGLQVIDNGAFFACEKLKEAILPDTVHTVGGQAFEACSSLEEVHIPASLTFLDRDTFSMTAVQAVTIPSNVKICDRAFRNCFSLEEVIIEDGVQSLEGTFYNCISLRNVYIYSRDVVFMEEDPMIPEGAYDPFGGCEDLTIHGYAGSTAETYAEKHGITFVEIIEGAE